MIRHLPFCLYVPSCPPSLTGRNILARLEITCRCCANSSSAVPCYASACPLRWGSLVGKYFACRTESVANPLTMSRKSQHMTTRPSCPTTPLLVAWSHSCDHVTCSGPIHGRRKIFLVELCSLLRSALSSELAD